MSFKQFARGLSKITSQKLTKTSNETSPDYAQFSCSQVYLERDDVRRLTVESQVIHVMAGTAWITTDGTDVIVDSGEQIVMRRGKYPALISAAGKHPLVYEVWYTNRSPSPQTLIPRLTES